MKSLLDFLRTQIPLLSLSPLSAYPILETMGREIGRSQINWSSRTS